MTLGLYMNRFRCLLLMGVLWNECGKSGRRCRAGGMSVNTSSCFRSTFATTASNFVTVDRMFPETILAICCCVGVRRVPIADTDVV